MERINGVEEEMIRKELYEEKRQKEEEMNSKNEWKRK